MKRSLGRKLYYSIGEVAEMTHLQPYTLRAWEKEFGCLRPRRIHGKNRAYRERDIGIVLLIKRLLYEERYSTRGVRQKLKKEPELLRGTGEDLATLEGVLGREIPEFAQMAPTDTSDGGDVELRPGVELQRWMQEMRTELKEILRLLS